MIKLCLTIATKVLLALLSILPLHSHAQDSASYSSLLKKYVVEDGIKYKQWASHKADKAALKKVLKDWASVDATKLPKREKAAFRINLYNAAMINVVLDNYPLKSVTKLGKKDFAIFDKAIIKTPTGAISLNTLEKKQLIKDFPDARIHFAVNCASVSCPPLLNEAFEAKKLDRQLNQQATLFANSKHAAQPKGNTTKYSELFTWYAKDFGTKNPAIYLNKFRTKKLNSKSKISWIKYDWNLNESK